MTSWLDAVRPMSSRECLLGSEEVSGVVTFTQLGRLGYFNDAIISKGICYLP